MYYYHSTKSARSNAQTKAGRPDFIANAPRRKLEPLVFTSTLKYEYGTVEGQDFINEDLWFEMSSPMSSFGLCLRATGQPT